MVGLRTIEGSYANSQIDFIFIDSTEDGFRVDVMQAKANSWSLFLKIFQKSRHQKHFNAVWDCNPKKTFGRGWVKWRLTPQQGLKTTECLSHRQTQCFRAWGPSHAASMSCQQFISKKSSKTPQIMTHGRLADPHKLSSLCDTSRFQKSIQSDQKIQIEPSQIDMIDTHH
ncbi:hypothetical protein AA0229_2646 [Gluconobacter cerinus NRIC 0229]|nr:hypothetical protein AA0229_2646 [Gluconobacter cerinus NRIC 0229]